MCLNRKRGNQVNNLSLIIAPVPKSTTPWFSLSTQITQKLVLNNYPLELSNIVLFVSHMENVQCVRLTH